MTYSSCLATEHTIPDFPAFYRENLGPIYRFVYSKVGNREEAEDLTSQIFLKAVRGLNYERGAQSMRKWLFQVASTTIVDYWRSHSRATTSSLDVLLDAGWEGPTEDDLFGVTGKPAERVQRTDQVGAIDAGSVQVVCTRPAQYHYHTGKGIYRAAKQIFGISSNRPK